LLRSPLPLGLHPACAAPTERLHGGQVDGELAALGRGDGGISEGDDVVRAWGTRCAHEAFACRPAGGCLMDFIPIGCPGASTIVFRLVFFIELFTYMTFKKILLSFMTSFLNLHVWPQNEFFFIL